MSDLLSIAGISKGYTRGGRFLTVLSDVSLEVAQGEVVAVIGRRLGGKSTLLQIVAGLEAPDEGTVTIAGRPVRPPGRRSFREWLKAWREASTDPVLGHDMVLVTRDGPHQDLEVGKYVGGPLAVRGSRRRDVRRIAGAQLERVGASDCLGRSWGDLSNYQRALVGLARAFAGDPQLVIFDDLLDAHDRRDTDTLSDILHTILEESHPNCGVLLTTGQYDPAIVLANRVCQINQQGELVHTSGRRPDAPSDRPTATVHHLPKPAAHGNRGTIGSG
jgi:ABC-type nitrate/sulfonate/bicarbonate transport system ATPase subunit